MLKERDNLMDKIYIIGAGPAGLSAAYSLCKKGKKPVVFEESSYIGGISRTHCHKGNLIDLGGHRFFTKNQEVMNLWLEIMPLQGKPAKDDILLKRKVRIAEGGPDPETQNEVMLKRRRISRIYFLRKFFDYPISVKLQTFSNMGFLRTFKAGIGYIKALLFKRKENSLKDFYINRFGEPLYKMFFENYTQKVWGVSPEAISPSWGAQRVKGLSILKIFKTIFLKFLNNDKNIETSLIEEFYYPKKGPGQLYEAMAAKIEEMGGKILLNTKVSAIEIKDNRIVSLTAGGKQYSADAVFSSMPVKNLVASFYGDNPSEKIKDIASKLPYRDYITVGLLVNKLKIKNNTKIKTLNDLIPDCWLYIQEPQVHLGRLQIFNNWSPYMISDLNKVWIGLEYFASEGDSLWQKNEKDFVQMAVKEVAQIGLIYEEDVLDSICLKVKKAYPAYFGAYENFSTVRDYLDSFENLYCIGRNGQHRYNNMDHSILTGLKAAEVCCDKKLSKDIIWAVNTESEYHESK